MKWWQRVLWFLACAFVFLAPLSARAQCIEEIHEHSFIVDSDRVKIWDVALMREISERLAQYQDLQILVSACYSGGFADEAKDGRYPLGGDWSLTTPVNKNFKNVAVERRGTETNAGTIWLNGTQNPGDPKVVGLRTVEEPNKPAKEYWAHGFLPYWIKKFKAQPDSSALELFNAAKGDFTQAFKADHGSRFEFGGEGDSSSVHSGTLSNHAIMWAPITEEDSGAEPTFKTPRKIKEAEESLDTALYSALHDAGYNQAPLANNSIDYASDSRSPNEPVLGKVVNRGPATRDNLFQMLTNLNNRFAANPGAEKGFVFLHAHGNVVRVKGSKASSGSCDQPKQGRLLEPGDEIQLDVDAKFSSNLLEVLELANAIVSPYYPYVTVATSEESYSGAVSISLDGVEVGGLSMVGSSSGAEYEVEVNSGPLEQLFNAGSLDDEAVVVRFDFGGGNFRIATEVDLDAGLNSYGVGLAAPPLSCTVIVESVPSLREWGAWFLGLGLLVTGTVWTRRRQLRIG